MVWTVIMWSAYVNGFICALFAFFYLRCAYATFLPLPYHHPTLRSDARESFPSSSTMHNPVIPLMPLRHPSRVQRRRRVHVFGPPLRLPHRHHRGSHPRERHRRRSVHDICRAGGGSNVRGPAKRPLHKSSRRAKRNKLTLPFSQGPSRAQPGFVPDDLADISQSRSGRASDVMSFGG
jgi:hypothetical protein